jgi:hypothetical protein
MRSGRARPYKSRAGDCRSILAHKAYGRPEQTQRQYGKASIAGDFSLLRKTCSKELEARFAVTSSVAKQRATNTRMKAQRWHRLRVKIGWYLPNDRIGFVMNECPLSITLHKFLPKSWQIPCFCRQTSLPISCTSFYIHIAPPCRRNASRSSLFSTLSLSSSCTHSFSSTPVKGLPNMPAPLPIYPAVPCISRCLNQAFPETKSMIWCGTVMIVGVRRGTGPEMKAWRRRRRRGCRVPN